MPARRSQEGHPLTHGLLAKRVAADAAASTAEGASPFRMVINLDGERLTHVPQVCRLCSKPHQGGVGDSPAAVWCCCLSVCPGGH